MSQRDTLTKLIERNQETIEDAPRDYIGASIIGSECMRQIWYEYKGYKGIEVPTKTRRTWAIGKALESLVIGWLMRAGIKNYDLDNINPLSQINIPYFQGSIDSLIEISNTTYILEIKTAKDASFKIFVKKGLREWNFQYYCQIQSYMGMSGIFSAYIVVLNKDNSELSDELIIFDAPVYQRLKEKARIVSEYQEPPARISNSPIWFQCKLCKFNKVCHK